MTNLTAEQQQAITRARKQLDDNRGQPRATEYDLAVLAGRYDATLVLLLRALGEDVPMVIERAD